MRSQIVSLALILIISAAGAVSCQPGGNTPVPSETPLPSQIVPVTTPAPTPAPSVSSMLPAPPPTTTPISPPSPTAITSPTSLPATSTPTPTPALPPDTTPPSTVTGLVVINAYDGKVNLWWDKSTAADFDHYNIYLDKAEISDITGVKPIQQIKDIAACNFQATGLDNGAKCYLAVTAVDRNGNENRQVASTSATPQVMPRGTKDPSISADIYESETAWAGTTLLPDNHDPQKPRIIEVNMLGEIIWQYTLPENLKQYTNPGFDVEPLATGNVLFVLPGNGVYEIDRSGKIIWSYLTPKISHDADRLPNGNTLFAFGFNDQKSDAQVTEVNPKGEIVWQWYARDFFDKPPYNSIYDEGWTHTNAVSRLENGNTLISLRNFSFMVEVDPRGAVVKTIGEGVIVEQHDPEVLPNGNILAASLPRERPHSAVEIDLKTGKIVWQYLIPNRGNWPVRDANRLPNGNTLITGATEIVEVTPGGKIVWRLKLQGTSFTLQEASGRGFYKANRINQTK